MSSFTVLLDACVLYPAPTRDLLIRLARTGLFQAKWTDEIHEEWIRAAIAQRNLDPVKLSRTRQLMDEAVPDCLVRDYDDLIAGLVLPDPNDRHVLAAAIRAKANTIVTANLNHFPESHLEKYDIEAQHPDDFILLQFGLSEPAVLSAARSARGALKAPPLSVDDYLNGLRKCGLIQTAAKLSQFASDI